VNLALTLTSEKSPPAISHMLFIVGLTVNMTVVAMTVGK